MTPTRQTHASRAAIERAVTNVYRHAEGPIANDRLYECVADELGAQPDLFARRQPVGQSGQRHNIAARDARWAQQTLKINGLLERVSAGRWQLTTEGRSRLTRPVRGLKLLAFSTRLGMAVWGDCRDVIAGLDEQITLCLTSPCYPIARGRAYGRIKESEYVDWLCDILEPVVARLVTGGNIALVLGNDVFESRSPARSLYIERLTLALADRFGLSLMDRLVWHNPSKAPAPVQWASIKRCQLNAGYEHVLWFTNDPMRVVSNNQRVLQPHTKRQQQLMQRGGEQRDTNTQDGAYRLRSGQSFSQTTAGRIPRNVLTFGHGCAHQRKYRQSAEALGLPAHGAPAPVSLGRFLCQFLNTDDGLMVEPMAGSGSFAQAAELENQRWLACEQYGELLRGGAERFADRTGYALNTDFAAHFS